MHTLDRKLLWDTCYNVRDMGGLATQDGREIQRGVLVRSDLLARLTEEGERQLLDYGVRTIVDLRAPPQAAEEPYRLMQATCFSEALTYLNLPVEDYTSPALAIVNGAQSRAEIYCLTLTHFRREIATVLRGFLHAQPGGVLIHCHAGKDRTGIITALLLALVGVPGETIAADYVESNRSLQPLCDRLLAEAGDDASRLAQIQHKIEPVTPEMMQMLLDYLTTTYGGIRSYLLQAGLAREELSAIQLRLLSKQPQ